MPEDHDYPESWYEQMKNTFTARIMQSTLPKPHKEDLLNYVLYGVPLKHPILKALIVEDSVTKLAQYSAHSAYAPHLRELLMVRYSGIPSKCAGTQTAADQWIKQKGLLKRDPPSDTIEPAEEVQPAVVAPANSAMSSSPRLDIKQPAAPEVDP